MKTTFPLRDYLTQHTDTDGFVTVETSIPMGTFLDAAGVPDEVELDVHELLGEQRAIALIWDVDQVRSHYPHLSPDQAWEVLRECERHYQAENGLTWDDIAATATDLFADPAEQLRERVGRFARAVKDYNGDGPATDNLTDLLADARHWCDARGLDFAALNGTAYQHYLAERQGEE